jgi:hypothetical protein
VGNTAIENYKDICKYKEVLDAFHTFKEFLYFQERLNENFYIIGI